MTSVSMDHDEAVAFAMQSFDEESKMTNEKTYLEMYTEALKKTGGSYKGYTGGNALSLYVDEKFDVNAAADATAHDALCEVLGN